MRLIIKPFVFIAGLFVGLISGAFRIIIGALLLFCAWNGYKSAAKPSTLRPVYFVVSTIITILALLILKPLFF